MVRGVRAALRHQSSVQGYPPAGNVSAGSQTLETRTRWKDGGSGGAWGKLDGHTSRGKKGISNWISHRLWSHEARDESSLADPVRMKKVDGERSDAMPDKHIAAVGESTNTHYNMHYKKQITHNLLSR